MLQRIEKVRHRRKHSVEINTDVLQEEFNQNAAPPVVDANNHSVVDAADSPSSSLQVQDSAQVQQNTREEWAATRIQTAFRGFLVLFSYLLTCEIQAYSVKRKSRVKNTGIFRCKRHKLYHSLVEGYVCVNGGIT